MVAVRLSGTRDPEFSAYYLLWQRIPHYYGDIVRQLFLLLVIVMMVGAPFYATDLSVEFPFVIVGAVVLVALAALTNPLKRTVMYINSIVSGVGLILYEITAIISYNSDLYMAFTLRQAIAILFLFSFYFSMKTMRAMLMGKIGEVPSNEDFRIQRNEERWKKVASGKKKASGMTKIEHEEVALDGLGRPAAPDLDRLD